MGKVWTSPSGPRPSERESWRETSGRSTARPIVEGFLSKEVRSMEDRLEVRLSGTGGQGLILAGMILSDAVVLEGKWAAQSQSYEPLSRGGSSRADVVISAEEGDYPLVTEPDFLLVLDGGAGGAGPLG